MESVQNYPLPPKIEDCNKHIKVVFNGITLADTRRSKRVLEKGLPPVYYIPPEDVKTEFLAPGDKKTHCPWKGDASYYHITVDDKTARYACWYYPSPVKEFELIVGFIAFYAQKMDECYVDEELVTPQQGKFYGGWITAEIEL